MVTSRRKNEKMLVRTLLFFYNNVIPFIVARSSEYFLMFESVAKHGIGFKPPSYHEIRVKYLDYYYDTISEELEKHRIVWRKYVCRIMTDGWIDRRRRTLLNFLVHSPKGTVFLKSIDAYAITKTDAAIFKMIDEVVEEVGEENAVQVVTDNATNYKAADELLMEKRKNLFWTPCVAHCIDLMFEDFEKKIPLHKDIIARGKKFTYIYGRTSLITLLHKFTNDVDLIRPTMTRFATSYLTLGCLNDHHTELLALFKSKEWKTSKLAKNNDGKIMQKTVQDKLFWKNVLNCMRGAFPLVKVLHMVDSDEKEAMRYIYEEMDRAKEKIRTNFNEAARSYNEIWNIIDERWDGQLHRPLHAASLFLNLMLHYAHEFTIDEDVVDRMYARLCRMVDDSEKRSKIDLQLEDFKGRVGKFGSEFATYALEIKTPTHWWESYGGGHPELQWFAMRVLSLTCSSFGCERNWSAFERVHTKKRSRLKQLTMNKVVFVMVSKLEKKKMKRKSDNYEVQEIDSEDEGKEWIENVKDDEDGEEDISLDVGQDASIGDVHGDDLEVPAIDEEGDDDIEEEENEDEDDELDDYPPDLRLNGYMDV